MVAGDPAETCRRPGARGAPLRSGRLGYHGPMIFRWFTERRRRKLLAQPFCDEWSTWLFQDMPLAARLGEPDVGTLMNIARIIIHEKAWFARGGLELTDRIRLCIAAQAALLLLGFKEHDYYRNVREIIVAPGVYDVQRSDGLLVDRASAAGTAHLRGPIELAWDQTLGGAMNIEDGRNVVLHEFAHKLDLLDGWADGTPPMKSRETFDHWVAVMTEHYEQMAAMARAGRRTLLDKYGLTNPAEFFAVATETFFEKPTRMHRELPELYNALQNYYHQDPADW
jgi:hypothetical protein